MLQYLERVSEVMAEFEAQLWERLLQYDVLAARSPTLLVDCLRVVVLQVGNAWATDENALTWRCMLVAGLEQWFC